MPEVVIAIVAIVLGGFIGAGWFLLRLGLHVREHNYVCTDCGNRLNEYVGKDHMPSYEHAERAAFRQVVYTITLDILGGVQIEQAATIAVMLANIVRVPVLFTFNEINLAARYGDRVKPLVDAYYKESEHGISDQGK